VGHRTRWIRLDRGSEGVDRFVVVEGVEQEQSLVEPLLRFGIGGRDVAAMRAETFDLQRNGANDFGRLALSIRRTRFPGAPRQGSPRPDSVETSWVCRLQ
jgi:hypothetical protein